MDWTHTITGEVYKVVQPLKLLLRPGVAMMPTLLSLVALAVVMTTTPGATSNNKIGIITKLSVFLSVIYWRDILWLINEMYLNIT